MHWEISILVHALVDSDSFSFSCSYSYYNTYISHLDKKESTERKVQKYYIILIVNDFDLWRTGSLSDNSGSHLEKESWYLAGGTLAPCEYLSQKIHTCQTYKAKTYKQNCLVNPSIEERGYFNFCRIPGIPARMAKILPPGSTWRIRAWPLRDDIYSSASLIFFCLTTNGCLNIITWHPTHLFFGQHIITCFLQEKSRKYVFFHCIGQRQKKPALV